MIVVVAAGHASKADPRQGNPSNPKPAKQAETAVRVRQKEQRRRPKADLKQVNGRGALRRPGH